MSLAYRLHERLQAERVAARVYDALLAKPQASIRGEVEALRDDTRRHVVLLERALRGDETAAPLSLAAFAPVGEALVAATAEPLTALTTAVELALGHALAAEEAWDRLVVLAEGVPHPLVDELRGARDDARRHVARLRGWTRTNLPVELPLPDKADGASSLLPV